MSNLIASGVAWLAGVQRENAGTPVSYARASTSESISLTVVWGETTEESTTIEGVTTEVKSRDAMIVPADLTLSHPFPAAGDLISDPSGTKWEVNREPGKDAWRWSDPFNTRFRVHVKSVGE